MIHLTPRHGRPRQTIPDVAKSEARFGRIYSQSLSISSCGGARDGGSAAGLPGRRRGTGRQGKTAQGASRHRPDLQGAPRWLQLCRDPCERALLTSNTYYDWLLDRAYLLVPAQDYVGQFLATFRAYPPRQKAASFSLEQVMSKLQENTGSP